MESLSVDGSGRYRFAVMCRTASSPVRRCFLLAACAQLSRCLQCAGQFRRQEDEVTRDHRQCESGEPHEEADGDVETDGCGGRPWAQGPYQDSHGKVDENRIEHYAPGFGDTVIASRGISARDYETYNPNYIGGDINGGAVTLKQSVLGPTPRVNPYRTPLRGVYLCSASTPPGPGVHGMSGYLAARSALRHEFGIHTTPSLAPDQIARTGP